MGGTAKANLTATGDVVNAGALAVAGAGAMSGHASTKVKVTGNSGNFGAAAAVVNGAAGSVTILADTEVRGSVVGTSTGKTKAVIGSAATPFAVQGSAVANVAAAPLAADTAAVLAANINISTAFGATPDFFAIEELGGAYSNGGSGTETVTSTADLTLNLGVLAARQDLLLGLYNPTVVGSGFTSLTFTLTGDGQTLVNQTFTTVAAAEAFFADDALDLGSLATGPLSGSILTLEATLTVTTASAGTGFYTGLIIGDPPPAASGTSHFAQAMAGLGAAGRAAMASMAVSPDSRALALAVARA